MSDLFGELKQCLYCWMLMKKGHKLSEKLPREAMTEPVDFLITWVDGSDPKWRAEKEEHQRRIGILKEHKDNGEERYRDWGLLRYWFRAVEAYAPWVRNVYLVTEGHVPEWLNLEAPKLKHIRHSDYIPREYLPTFNANVIEMNFHRIEGLSEHFVYFNDDVFLMRPSTPEDFFQGGKPNYTAIAEPLRNQDNGAFRHMNFVVLGAINNAFQGRVAQIMKDHPEQWFHKDYGAWGNDFNTYSFRLETLLGMYMPHLAAPFHKSTFERLWEVYPDLLRETTEHRFRNAQDAQHQLVSLWDMMNGDFYPVSMHHHGKLFNRLTREKTEITDAIRDKKYLSICINDSENVSYDNFLELKELVADAMEREFPEKSSFEK